MKEGYQILKIRKVEAEYLRKNNYGWAINSGHGTYRNLLAVEDKRVLKALDEFRNSIRVK